MISLARGKNQKLIFQKNTSSAKLIQEFLKSLDYLGKNASKEDMLNSLKYHGSYKGRSSSGSASTMGVRASELKFYMFTYALPSDRESTFLSATGTRVVKDRTPENIAKMGLVNLFSIQFPHPFSNTPNSFKIHFGRLLVKLLLDSRIGKKLYFDEACYFLPFIKTMNENIYENLINSILEFRLLSYESKTDLFKGVSNYDDVFSNCFHEFKYYFVKLFQELKVFDVFADEEHNGCRLFSFIQGTQGTRRNDAYASRSGVPGFFCLSEHVATWAMVLNDRFDPFEHPKSMSDADILSKEDFLLDLYQKNPLKYLAAIDKDVEQEAGFTDIIFNMVHMSKYGSKDGKDFENSLKPLFDLFTQVSAEIHSGSGDTDLLCVVQLEHSEPFKMNVDGKSTSKSTSSLNPSRLTNHLKINGSRYCIVVSPRFAKGATMDIAGSKIVTLKAEMLAKYCICEFNKSPTGYLDYTPLDIIVNNNLGKDITGEVQNLISSYYSC